MSKLEEKLISLREEWKEKWKQIRRIQKNAPNYTNEDAIIIYDESKLSMDDQEELERLRRERDRLRYQMKEIQERLREIK